MPSHSSGHLGSALPPMRCNDFIEYVLQNHVAPTTILVCSSREMFLESLQLSLQIDDPLQGSGLTGESDDIPHPLLVPTIHQLATSKTISMAFTPTIPHLRAYLATYAPSEGTTCQANARTKPGCQIPMLAIYGLLSLHRTTTEHSVQGLSRSLAIAAEAAETGSTRLILTEDLGDRGPSTAESNSEALPAPARDPWTEQVPLLNSSLALSDDRVWAGRTVDVRAVVGKWCKIVRA